jgi:hypothetical protein
VVGFELQMGVNGYVRNVIANPMCLLDAYGRAKALNA